MLVPFDLHNCFVSLLELIRDCHKQIRSKLSFGQIAHWHYYGRYERVLDTKEQITFQLSFKPIDRRAIPNIRW